MKENIGVYKRVLLGVTGGIAVYKSPDLVRRLQDAGSEVRVAMTPGAQAFITPLTFQAVSGNPVHTQLLDEEAEAGMGHIQLARWADLVLIAPASADFIAKLAHGLAGDLLSTLCLATEAPIALAPAMNQAMWSNPAVRDNVAILKARGHQFIGPDSGGQACGDVGYGRMSEPAAICAAIKGPGLLKGLKVLVTAGPTREAIDPVRYIGNRSSGKMGYAVATAASNQGADVFLVSGPVNLNPPQGVEVFHAESAKDMHKTVMENLNGVDIFISTAAVADYGPIQAAPEKIKKRNDKLNLELTKNPDILAEVAALDSGPFTVGFAAETEKLRQHALEKLMKKKLDMIAANWVGVPGSGFDSDSNELLVLTENDSLEIQKCSKSTAAAHLIEWIAEKYKKTAR